MGKTVKNRGMSLKVKQFSFMDKYGEHEAAEGHKLLVVRTEWENIIPLQLVGQLGLATKYMIWAVNNIVFPNFDSKITVNTYKIRFGQKLRMLPLCLQSAGCRAG
ncbi:MAG: hypothetical protein JRD93_19885 [Deltaproteobacteria bacterium]|nr:hypothetical protein [Deltaproteobacteria bacterium]